MNQGSTSPLFFSLGLLQLVLRDTYAPFIYDGRIKSRKVLKNGSNFGKMPPSQTATSKKPKPRMTLAQVSAYDDILTDALVDHVSGL